MSTCYSSLRCKPHSLLCSHVVFGKVIEGMDVVKAIEAQGSGSGKPSSKIVIKDSGELTE